MSKAVLISIQPKWCELIASGKKTIEVRKTKPKIPTPFKCYIYETRAECDRPIILDSGALDFHGRGEVIGEFVCDKIIPISVYYDNPNCYIALKEFPYVCMTDREIMNYLGNGKRGYGWHVSDIKIYDMPKKLSEFYKPCPVDNCAKCELYYWTPKPCHGRTVRYCNAKPLNRPPQSWCYVERLVDEQ